MKQQISINVKQNKLDCSVNQSTVNFNIEPPFLDIGHNCDYVPLKIHSADDSITINKEKGTVYIGSNVVLAFDSINDFPTMGNNKSIYVDISTQRVYFWNGAYYGLTSDTQYDFDVLFDNALLTIKEIDGGSSV